MPVVWLFVVTLATWRWRRIGPRLALVGAIVLVLSSVPLVGRGLVLPLRAGAVTDAALQSRAGATIVVPTAGAFRDVAGVWWPGDETIRRIVRGRQLQIRLGLPLIVTGGAPPGTTEAEALVGARVAGLPEANVRLETTARNSAESARAVAEMLGGSGSAAVLLVTSASHIARMQGALRRQGLEVTSVMVVDPLRTAADRRVQWWRILLPSRRGFNLTAAALREYTAIAWYLASGWVRPRDLLRSQ